MKSLKTGFTLLFYLIFSSFCYSQQLESLGDSVVQKLERYAKQKVVPTLFVHFDKNVYTDYENVWLTAYLLRTDTTVKDYHTLSVALIRNADRSILAEEKFVMASGLTFGNIFLPDSLPPGDYSFIAYANITRNGIPEDVFIQPVTIKSAKESPFIATLKIAEPVTPATDTAHVVLRAFTQDIRLLKEIPVTYIIGDTLHPLIKQKTKTDAFGEAKISIPLKRITASNNFLQAEVRNGNALKVFRIRLPVYKNYAVVKFYPEGGNLIEGQTNTVGWEVRNATGEPLPVSGVLYKGKQPVDTIQTNGYGMGRFSFKPESNNKYYVKLLFNDAVDSLYVLPAALGKGPVISIANALAADTLTISLTDNEKGEWLLVVHNYEETFITSTIISLGRPLSLKIPLDGVPKGLATFTLLDSKGKPWAERLFFAHYDVKSAINISTDRKEYKTREKVQLKLKVLTGANRPAESFVSIACVQENRLEPRKMNDIESYVYLKHELTDLPFKKGLLGKDDADIQYLEDILLIKGWRRYTWQDAMATKASDSSVNKSSLTYKGAVTLSGKPSKGTLQLGVFGGKALGFINTDGIGNFSIEPGQLIVPPDNKVNLVVNNKKQGQYSIRVNDPYVAMNRKLAATLSFQNFDPPLVEQNSQSVLIKADERAKRLLDVKVTTKKDNTFYGGIRNECGDYVCQYNILNCINHPYGYAIPVKGRSYRHNDATVVYKGCGNFGDEGHFLVSIKGINSHKEFYVPDYAQFNPPDPELLSTIFWKHMIVTDGQGEAEVSFYTSDIAGRFRVVIQGVTRDDYLYGEQSFEVRKSE